MLDQVVAHRLYRNNRQQGGVSTVVLSTVHEHKDLLRCFQTVRDSGNYDPPTVREARGFVGMLEDEDFYHVTVDMLFHQLQKRSIVYITGISQRLHDSMQTVCDAVLSHAKEWFSFTKHLISVTLLQGDLFPVHTVMFPDSVLETTVEAYKAKLKTELYLIYENYNFTACRGALTLFQYIMEHDILEQPWNNLQGTCTETVFSIVL
ncbi:hypothetical protein N1851_020519 [Merluccius polli]|uniref:Uncharacterized protein n=1 Tax=Merluccius polli TaxID=89951 RepID=A0AA47MKI9_MERPO|nr:hypothetical protein N1851_020519 [Merluccius polli]